MSKNMLLRWWPFLRPAILWTLASVSALSISTTSVAQTVDLVDARLDPTSRVVLRGRENSQGKVPDETSFEHMTPARGATRQFRLGVGVS
jgi:hypothetical protein